MSEVWMPIIDFSRYEISNRGDVRDTKTNRRMVRSLIQNGIPTVGLVQDDKRVRRRSIPVLVAQHYLPNEIGWPFDTPIQLDGDRSNCNVENLLWRPRWFALQYHREKKMDEILPYVKVRRIDTGDLFESVREASMFFGYLESSIVRSIDFNETVWPDHVLFEVV